jgi:hypothetical protein
MNRSSALVCLAGGLVALAGCARSGPHAMAKVVSVPAPRNPDLTPVAERFYEQIVGGHLGIAYGMLSPAGRAKLDRSAFDARYANLDDAQIDARQAGDRAIIAVIAVPARGSRSARSLRERVAFTWSGDEWTIDTIDRREAPPAASR